MSTRKRAREGGRRVSHAEIAAMVHNYLRRHGFEGARRAFLKDAPVLILDEATSHLDAVNEQAVRQALEALMTDRTTLVIAHRLSTVRGADKIVALDQGQVIESGTHDELLARGGLYAQLVACLLYTSPSPRD